MAQNTNAVLTVDFKTPVCDQIPQSVVEKALGKKVTEVKSTMAGITNMCKYYTDKENYIEIRLNKLNYENQKTGQSAMEEAKIETDSSIKAEHFMVIPIPQPSIVNIIIKINDNLLLTVENGLSTEYSKKQVVAVASNAVKHLITNSSKAKDSSK